MRGIRSSILRVSHSHTVITSHPVILSAVSFSLSRSTFLVSFAFQNLWFDFGFRPILHPCACQKHPWTKSTFLRDGNTMSGVPGRSFLCTLNRYPNLCSVRRTTSSGVVSLRPIEAIIRLRVCGSSFRTIFFRYYVNYLRRTLTQATVRLVSTCGGSFRFRHKIWRTFLFTLRPNT